MRRKDPFTPMERRNRARIQAEGRAAFNNGESKDHSRYRAGSVEAHWYEEGWLLEWQLREQLKRQGGAA